MMLQDFSNLVSIVINISSTERYQHIKVGTGHHVEYLFLVDEFLVDARTQTIVYDFTRNAWNGFLTGRIDINNAHIIEL